MRNLKKSLFLLAFILLGTISAFAEIYVDIDSGEMIAPSKVAYGLEEGILINSINIIEIKVHT